ncbi:hypothetical protein EIP91_000267 [Steccherinum ochraceum]|uniref:Uncharacterized protein n=1 Tax=Steccherinum ochraceum TaxID=92696 RepID=A0A4R0RIQ6_9APHY|nr:hypothetical protein EIP91_000267 [Steccherinum ochraceum]
MSPSPALPLEVHEFIIDAVDELRSISNFNSKIPGYGIRDRVYTLRACALTCRAWLPRARMHLQTCRPDHTTVQLSTPHHLSSLVDFLRKAPLDAKVHVGSGIIIAPSFRENQTWVSRIPYELGSLLRRRRSLWRNALYHLSLTNIDLSVVGTSPLFYKSLLLIQTEWLIVDSMQYSHLSQFARLVSILDPVHVHCHGWFPQESGVRSERDPSHSVAFRGNRIKKLLVPVVWADVAHCDSWRFHTPHLSKLILHTRWPNSRFMLEDEDNTFRSISKLFSLLHARQTCVKIENVCNIRYRSKFSDSKPNTLTIAMEADAYRRLGLPFVADIIAQVMSVTIRCLLIKIKGDTQPSHDDVTAPGHWSVIDDVLVRIVAGELKEHKPRPYRCWISMSVDPFTSLETKKTYIAAAPGDVDDHTAPTDLTSSGDAWMVLDEIWKDLISEGLNSPIESTQRYQISFKPIATALTQSIRHLQHSSQDA